MKQIIRIIYAFAFNVIPAVIVYITAIKIDFNENFKNLQMNWNQHLPFILSMVALFISFFIYAIVKLIIEQIKVQKIQSLYIRYYHILLHNNNLLQTIPEKLLNDEFSTRELKIIGFGDTDINRIKSITK
jgi:hypothetical protein